MSGITRIADFWDRLTAEWLAGRDPLPDPLPRWHASYRGRGDGEVTRAAFAEPYIGDLRGSPRVVTFGLNPGVALFDLQARDGIYADEIRQAGSYSAWAADYPYLGETWTSRYGPNPFHARRLSFARHWLDDPEVGFRDLLTFELYPWHSKRVTGVMAPPAEIIDEFIWQPVAELPVEFVFAFGKDWMRVCEELGLREYGRWGKGGDNLGSPVESRTAVAFRLPSGQSLVVVWQLGYAGPPARDDVVRLRQRLRGAG